MSKATFHYLDYYTWRRVIGWIRRKHRRVDWNTLRRRYFHHGWQLGQDGVDRFDTIAVTVTVTVPLPGNEDPATVGWMAHDHGHIAHGIRGEPDAVEAAGPVRRAGWGNDTGTRRLG